MLFGPVVTVAFEPYRDDLPESGLGFGSLFYQAVADAPPGAVLVLSAGGYPDVSHGGGTKLSRLHNHGLAGVLTDGRCATSQSSPATTSPPGAQARRRRVHRADPR